MKKKKVTFIELVKKNKEALMNDPKEIARIEERLEAKHSNKR
ncbi:Fur-regulated basic protein B [Mesobacillus persicus]|uniref:Fur-regulated basic protein B n=1 Tax=Mesobacillus persicus TaxID=930146 RepID=A0A1H7ZC09_9BACI|nr:FbpB family small basic protein [Mesobacillus persicus]SEM55039.1 Fur-regulated basic protein B [Mesobacillus persicus]